MVIYIDAYPIYLHTEAQRGKEREREKREKMVCLIKQMCWSPKFRMHLQGSSVCIGLYNSNRSSEFTTPVNPGGSKSATYIIPLFIPIVPQIARLSEAKGTLPVVMWVASWSRICHNLSG